MIATISLPPTAEADDHSLSSFSLRLSLAPAGPAPALLDGAWWPRSRDLGAELPSLAAVLDPLWGRITRVTVNPTHWPVLPPRLVVNGHVVKVGWFTTELDPHKILLLSYTAGRWDLLVVPPETTAPAAARLMTAASTSTGPQLTATALMTAEQAEQADQGSDTSSSYEATTGLPGRLAMGL
jgi:uncharacterized protein DUF5994